MQRHSAHTLFASGFLGWLRVSFTCLLLLAVSACGSSSGNSATGSSTGADTGGSTGDNGPAPVPVSGTPPLAVYGDLTRTDGTESGTVPVFPAGSTKPYSFLYGLTELNGEFYFQANTPANSFELWKTNGTPAGTVMVKDINPGANPAFHYRFVDFTEFNGALYFQANDGTNGYELWKTDGTNEGTVMVKDIDTRPGASSSPSDFTVFNGALYFSAQDGTPGRKLWRTNGTTAGTEKVLDTNISTGTDILPDSFSRGFPVLNGSLYFVGSDGAWRTDGTAAGSVFLGDRASMPWASNLWNGFGVQHNVLYFQADAGVSNWELFKTDGGPSMVMVKDINTENGGRRSDYTFSQYTAFKGSLYFQTKDNVNGPRFWKTDGTAEGTVLVKDFGVQIIKVTADTLYFGGGSALWKTDGTVEGTVMVKNYLP